MIYVNLKIVYIFYITICIAKPNPLVKPSLLACITIFNNYANCQITYAAWEQLNKCIKGAPVNIPDIERAITCACGSSQRSAVISAGLDYASSNLTPPASSPGPPVPRNHSGHHARILGTTPPGERKLPPDIGAPYSPPMVGRSSLADADYVAPDGSVAMASRRMQPPGVASLAAVVLGVVVVVLLGVVTGLCCSSRRQAVAAALEGEEESVQGEDDAEGEIEPGEGAEGEERGEERKGNGEETGEEKETETKEERGETTDKEKDNKENDKKEEDNKEEKDTKDKDKKETINKDVEEEHNAKELAQDEEKKTVKPGEKKKEHTEGKESEQEHHTAETVAEAEEEEHNNSPDVPEPPIRPDYVN